MTIFMQITEWADKFTIWVAVFTFISTIINFCINIKNEKKLSQNIQIILHHPNSGEQRSLQQTIKRRYATRAEIQGLLANVYAGQRYDIPYMGSPAYSEQIEAIQQGKLDALTINIEKREEYDKFFQNKNKEDDSSSSTP